MAHNNPFTLTFGKQPNTLINRYLDITTVTDQFTGDNPVCQTYLIEGVRGGGKTVLMTTIANTLKNEGWLVINLNPMADLLEDMAMRLQDAIRSGSGSYDKKISLSLGSSLGNVGIGLDSAERKHDAVSIITQQIKKISRKHKRVLITIDEVLPNENLRTFASQFQIFLREDFPFFLIMTGLFENIYNIQNDPALTFLLRSPKIRIEPLRLLQITEHYRRIFGIDEKNAQAMAAMTKGYAFAFQALGVVCWETKKNAGDPEVISQFDAMLDDFVYKKIWESLSPNDKKIILAVKEDNTEIKTIREKIGMTPQSFSKYRDGLIKKGIAVSKNHGYISLALPRFYEIVSRY